MSSMYGPPGGPYPGQPQDPWQAGQQQSQPWSAPPASGSPYAQDGYTAPMPQGMGDQYGAAGMPGQQPGMPQQMGGQPGFGGGWGGQPPEPKSGMSGGVLAGIVIVGLLAMGGIAGAAYVLTNKDDSGIPKAAASGSAAASKAAVPSPSAASSPSLAPSPTANASDDATSDPDLDAQNAKAGDCLVNKGTNSDPDLHKTTCASGTFQVLKRIDGTAEPNKCKSVPGYVYNYTYAVPGDEAQSFVLCMKKR